MEFSVSSKRRPSYGEYIVTLSSVVVADTFENTNLIPHFARFIFEPKSESRNPPKWS